MTASYTAESIEILSGLDPVKKRPGMYTDTQNPNHLAQEVIDNSVDEAIGGFATQIKVELHKDGSLSVEDNGRGMPVDKHPQYGLSGVEIIMTKLHAGGKFSNRNYRFAGGLHGVGVSVVNALSKRVDVRIYRNQRVHDIAFEHGICQAPLTSKEHCEKGKTGTIVRFWPEPSYFDTTKFSVPKLKHLLRAKAILCSGLSISFSDHQSNKHEQWCYQDGLKDYLIASLAGHNILPPQTHHGRVDTDEEVVEWALVWHLEGSERVNESYVNLIPTAQGGTHVNGLRSGLLEAIREFCELHHLTPKGVKVTADDVFDSCCYVLSVKIREPQFAGQTKERLNSRHCASMVSNIIKDHISLWLNQNVKTGQQLAQWIIDRAVKRQAQAKKTARKKVAHGPALPGKLSDCSSNDISETELFLVEGDSAGGSAKQARDKDFQAIMPLRGKILNTWEVNQQQILASQEIHDIAVAIGVEPGSSDLSRLRYGKICVLADADSDGAHIATLLCALFLRHFTPLVAEGHLFIAMPPLYRIDQGNHIYYALDDNEKDQRIRMIESKHPRANINVQRFKGLGEMNPSQLRETTMAVDTRRLIQLALENNKTPYQLMDKLLAKRRAADRKSWLEKQGNQAKT